MRVSLYQIFVRNRILRLSYKYKSFLSKVVNFFCKNYYTTILTIRYCAFGVFYFRFFFQCRFCLALALEALLKALVAALAGANCKCVWLLVLEFVLFQLIFFVKGSYS